MRAYSVVRYYYRLGGGKSMAKVMFRPRFRSYLICMRLERRCISTGSRDTLRCGSLSACGCDRVRNQLGPLEFWLSELNTMWVLALYANIDDAANSVTKDRYGGQTPLGIGLGHGITADLRYHDLRTKWSILGRMPCYSFCRRFTKDDGYPCECLRQCCQ